MTKTYPYLNIDTHQKYEICYNMLYCLMPLALTIIANAAITRSISAKDIDLQTESFTGDLSIEY